MEICTNPDILRIIYFIKILINAIMTVVPIGLIIFGLIDISKSTISDEDGGQKKNFKLFFKRIIYAVLIFAVVWIVNVIMNLLGGLSNGVNFTSCWTNANSNKIEELQKEKDALEKKNDSNSQSGSSAKPSNPSSDKKPNKESINPTKDREKNVILIGDSRFRGMCDSVTLDDNTNCVAEVGKGYNWLVSNSVVSQIDELIKANPNSYVVINLGVNDFNDYGNASSYANYYNNLTGKYPDIKLIVVSVNPIDDGVASKYGYTAKNSGVVTFNNKIKPLLNSKISYCDTYSKIKSNFKTSDGIHYTADTYSNIYKEIKMCLN